MEKAGSVLFKAGQKVLRADSCQPLVEAVREGSVTLRALARGHYPGERLKASEAPGVCSLGYWHAAGEQRHGLPPHRNEGIELTMAFLGESAVMVDGKGYVLRPGDIMITRPWQLHAVGDACFAKGKIGWLILDVGVRHPHQAWRWPAWVNLDKRDLALLTRSLRQNEDALRTATPELRDAFRRLVSIADAGAGLFRGSRIATGVCDVLLRLLELFHENPVRLRPALTDSLRSVRLFVQDLQAQPLPQSVEAMAEACGLGVTRFGILFKEATGATPGDYLLRRRLEEARRLLRASPALSVEAVGRRVGFSHGNYFARIFRKAYGVTPAVWRTSGAGDERE
jgi:AraC family L-rhamnose operon regulatory protein RhaS